MLNKHYWPKFGNQAEYLVAQTLFLWFCGILFTRLATDSWVGNRPSLVGISLISLVFLYMHREYYLTLAMRIPIVVFILYFAHVHLLSPGDFLLSKPIALSWAHFFVLWVAMNFSFLFYAEGRQGERFSHYWTTARCLDRAKYDVKPETESGKVVTLRSCRAAKH